MTLTGPGGSGKTRLAVEVCHDLADEFPGGIGFVALAPVSSADAAVATIAHELGVRRTGGKPATEDARGAPPPFGLQTDPAVHRQRRARDRGSTSIGTATRRLQTAADSRHQSGGVGRSGECEFPVAPLALPSPGDVGSIETLAANPAVALFLERAAAVRPDFVLTGDNAEAVVEICTASRWSAPGHRAGGGAGQDVYAAGDWSAAREEPCLSLARTG